MEILTKIPIYNPSVATHQLLYAWDCIYSNWISSRGKYVDLFEQQLSEYFDVKHAIAVSNGSVSLYLILIALGLKPGSKIMTPSLTYAATISSIHWANHIPYLVSSDQNMQMVVDYNLIKKIKPDVILVPQLYGDSPNMKLLTSICEELKIILIEDSAEAFGCKVENKHLGTYGLASSFSFFSNKVITTGEGGCILTNDDLLAYKMRLLKNQSHIGGYHHTGPGFNFRMTNIQAAIGCAQLEDINSVILRKKYIAKFYRENLTDKIKKHLPNVDSSEWLPLFFLPPHKNYKDFSLYMEKCKVEIRPCFTPIHLMGGDWNYELCDKVFKCGSFDKGFNLPAFPDLTQNELEYIVKSVNEYINL